MLPKTFLTIPITHRTLHDIGDGRPENSIAGAKAAITNDYAIEVDLQLSKDGIPMVFHDYSLECLTDKTGAIAQYNQTELGAIKLKHGSETIPTLSSLLSFVAGRVPLLIELKDQDGALGPNVGDLEKATCDLINQYKGDVALMSFNPHSVAKCAEFAPNIPRGLVTCAFHEKDWPLVSAKRRMELAEIPDYDGVGACFISHDRNDLTNSAVLQLKKTNVPILCWTVRSKNDEIIAREIADNITFEGYLA